MNASSAAKAAMIYASALAQDAAGQADRSALTRVARDDADAHAARVVVLHFCSRVRPRAAGHAIDEEAGQLVADKFCVRAPRPRRSPRHRQGAEMSCASPTCSRIFFSSDPGWSTHDPKEGHVGLDPRHPQRKFFSVLTELGVAHLGVPLQAVEARSRRLEGRDRAPGRRRGDRKPPGAP